MSNFCSWAISLQAPRTTHGVRVDHVMGVINTRSVKLVEATYKTAHGVVEWGQCELCQQALYGRCCWGAQKINPCNQYIPLFSVQNVGWRVQANSHCMVHSGTVYRVGLNLGPATLHMARGGHGIAMLKSLIGSIRWKSTDWNLCKHRLEG